MVFDKRAKVINGKRMVSSTHDDRITVHPHTEKNKKENTQKDLDNGLMLFIKSNSQGITDLMYKLNINLVKSSNGEDLEDSGVGKDVLGNRKRCFKRDKQH